MRVFSRGGTSLGWGSRPGPNFWLAINKSQAGGLTSLIFRKALSKLKLEFCTFISLKLGLEGNWGRADSSRLNTQTSAQT